MDSRQPVTNNKDKRKREKSNVNPAQTHCMETRSKAQEQAVFKRRKQETDPLKMGYILEKIFSNLDANSIKAARQVNPLWSIEGAKSLITKCYVKIPSELHAGKLSKKNTKMDKFKLFLSHKAKDFPVIPNIIVESNGDVELWQSFGVLGQQVKSLKLNNIGKEAELLQNLLDLLPNLKYLNFQDINLHEKISTIIKVINSAMSKRGKNGSSLIISILPLQPNNEEELAEIEKLSDCKNVRIEELGTCYWNKDVPNVEARFSNAVSKFLSTSQNVLKKLSLHNCALYLSLIEFPLMPALIQMNLYFGSPFPGMASRCKFSPSFRFSEKVPNLQEIKVDSLRFPSISASPDIIHNLLENTGTAPSVNRVKCTGKFSDCDVDTLLQAFPNTEELQVHVKSSSESQFRTLWTDGKKLKKLALNIDVLPFNVNFPDLDFLFTGFDARTVNRMKEAPNLDPFTPAELQELRVNPSICNLQELEHLSIHCCDVSVPIVPQRMLAVASKYEISQLPKNPRIFITFERTYGLKEAFEEVSKLPNFIVRFEKDLEAVFLNLDDLFDFGLDIDVDSD